MGSRVRKDTLSTIRSFVAKAVGKFKVRGRAYAQCQWQSTSLIGEESNDSWPIARYIWSAGRCVSRAIVRCARRLSFESRMPQFECHCARRKPETDATEPDEGIRKPWQQGTVRGTVTQI